MKVTRAQDVDSGTGHTLKDVYTANRRFDSSKEKRHVSPVLSLRKYLAYDRDCIAASM